MYVCRCVVNNIWEDNLKYLSITKTILLINESCCGANLSNTKPSITKRIGIGKKYWGHMENERKVKWTGGLVGARGWQRLSSIYNTSTVGQSRRENHTLQFFHKYAEINMDLNFKSHWFA